jgi:hypothetical protein
MPIADRAAPLSKKPDATASTDTAKEDRARVETTVPIAADALFEFISDIERLFRLNPHLEIETWQHMPDDMRFAALNETTGGRIETVVHVETDRDKRTIVLSYADGLKQATTLRVEDGDGHGCRLVVTEHYPVIEDAQDPRVAQVDRSLIPWINAIRRHLLGRQRWGWLPGWRWWNEHFLPGMPPRQRRIVRMILWISVLEFVMFLLIAAVFWAEQRGS